MVFFRDLDMTSTLCYLATGCSNSNRLILVLSFQVEKLCLHIDQYFFSSSWGKLTGQHPCHNPGPCTWPCGVLHQGKLLPRHSTGDVQRTEGSFAIVVWQEQFLWAFLHAWNNVWHLLLCKPQIFVSDWMKRLLCFPVVALLDMWLIIKHFQLVINE